MHRPLLGAWCHECENVKIQLFYDHLSTFYCLINNHVAIPTIYRPVGAGGDTDNAGSRFHPNIYIALILYNNNLYCNLWKLIKPNVTSRCSHASVSHQYAYGVVGLVINFFCYRHLIYSSPVITNRRPQLLHSITISLSLLKQKKN
jgi:hypothetical protein